MINWKAGGFSWNAISIFMKVKSQILPLRKCVCEKMSSHGGKTQLNSGLNLSSLYFTSSREKESLLNIYNRLVITTG